MRLALGILVLLHGVAIGDWIEALQNVVAARGLPRWFVYGVYLGEVAGPLLLIFGYYARLGAVMIAVNMVAAVALERSGGLFALTAHGGWAVELEAIYLFAAVALVFLGPGRLSFDRR